MRKRRKLLIHIAAALVIAGLMTWIAALYVSEHQRKKGGEYAALTRYSFALTCLTDPLNKFEKMTAFEDQINCLEVIADELRRLSIYIDMKNAVFGTDYPTLYTEIETTAILLEQGGTISGCSLSPFAEDGKISEEEAAVIQLLKEETEQLYHDMTVSVSDGNGYRYVLTPDETDRRLNEMIQNVRAQLVKTNQAG